MNNNERLEGKVVKLLNAREVVINLGRNSGVKCGMYFDVMDKDLENIVDPDTGEELGSIDRVKKTLKVTEVGEKYQYCLLWNCIIDER